LLLVIVKRGVLQRVVHILAMDLMIVYGQPIAIAADFNE
jgi:hypothetical protein